MKFSKEYKEPPTDNWVWGKESIIWGYNPDHKYTIKILNPAVGRSGCLSLQYHDHKSESWLVLTGAVWALIIQNGQVITRIMRSGDYQNLPTGTIHRMMGLTNDVAVLECSTPDAHAADKSAKKDVIRLHCVLGRECQENNSQAVSLAMQLTEEAILKIEAGLDPEEHNLSLLVGAGSLNP